MKRATQQTFAGGCSSGPEPVFSVVVVYGALSDCEEALDTCKLLVSSLGGETELRCSFWSFENLESQTTLPLAAKQAGEADLIIVASRHAPALPEHVARWVEAWTRRKRGQTAALAMLGGETPRPDGSSPAHLFLKSAAESAGIDFLSSRFKGPGLPVQEMRQMQSGRSFEGWGLND